MICAKSEHKVRFGFWAGISLAFCVGLHPNPAGPWCAKTLRCSYSSEMFAGGYENPTGKLAYVSFRKARELKFSPDLCSFQMRVLNIPGVENSLQKRTDTRLLQPAHQLP